MTDDTCDYCGDAIDGVPFPVYVERGFIIKSAEVKLFCGRRHALLWAREAT